MPKKSSNEQINGVMIEPTLIQAGGEVKIKYKGQLIEAGAAKIFLHIGYGNEHWHDIQDILMRKTKDGGYIVSFEVNGNNWLNFCFRDDHGHWDNNSGRNWKYQINQEVVAESVV